MNQNEEPKKEQNSNEQPEHHESWIEEISEKIDHALEKIDTNFPLSGAAQDEDLEIFPDDDANEEDGDFTEREHLDTNFPLSGGTDE